MVRPEKCLRCAGEVAQFPDLIYSIDPKSTASKCTDCVKKGKSCEDVPARLHRLLYELESAAACFTEGHASQKDIDIAQAAFDAEKLRSNHDTKISDAKAQKFPWKPMVQSQEKLGASISSAIVSTNRILVGYLTKEFAVITASFESVIDQLSRLRRDIWLIHPEAFAQEDVHDEGGVEVSKSGHAASSTTSPIEATELKQGGAY